MGNGINKTNFLYSIDNKNNFEDDEENEENVNFNILFYGDKINNNLNKDNNDKDDNDIYLLDFTKINKKKKINLNSNTSFFDKKNDDISIINLNLNFNNKDHQNKIRNTPSLKSKCSRKNSEENKLILYDLYKVEDYLIKISESCQKNPKIFPPNVFIYTLKTIIIKDCISSISISKDNFNFNKENEYGNENANANANENFDVEIIPPEEFNLVTKFIFENINRHITDLLDHFKSQRRRVFNDIPEAEQNEYIDVIKNFQQKKSEIINLIFKEFCNKLYFSAKSFINNFIFYICYFKLEYNDHNFELEIFNKFFNEKIFEKFCAVININKFMNFLKFNFNLNNNSNNNKDLEKNIIENLMSFNFLGIKE
jgi:hypothetical protein